MDLTIWRVGACVRAAAWTADCYGVRGVAVTKCFCGCREREATCDGRVNGKTPEPGGIGISDDVSSEAVDFSARPAALESSQ